MKVTQSPIIQFEPVTIVLETREEADMMWHLFNKGEVMGMDDYMKGKSHNFHDWRNLRYRMSDDYRGTYAFGGKK